MQDIIQSACDMKGYQFFTESLRSETRGLKWGNYLFRVKRIAPEQITLIRENCGKIHRVSAEMYGKDVLCLSFKRPEIKGRK